MHFVQQHQAPGQGFDGLDNPLSKLGALSRLPNHGEGSHQDTGSVRTELRLWKLA